MMFATLVLASGLIALGVTQFQYSYSKDMPSYIKKALRQKNSYKIMPREKKKSISNLTLTEVFDKIKDITKALNEHAKKNGYKGVGTQGKYEATNFSSNVSSIVGLQTISENFEVLK